MDTVRNTESHPGRPVVIGISGPSGSGKSTLAAALAEKLPGAVILSADTYYKKELPTMVSPLDGRTYPDWNHPASIDSGALCAELDRLCTTEIPYVLVDGAFLYCMEDVRARLSYKVFVTASLEMRLWRRICRNVETKHQTPEFIGGYYLACVRYREAEFSVPSARFADFTVLNETGFGDAVENLAQIAENLRKKQSAR